MANLDDVHREGLKIASLKARFSAFCIDSLILGVVIFIVTYSSVSELLSANDYEDVLNAYVQKYALYGFVIELIYMWGYTWMYGASIGKIVMKIKIVMIDTLDKPNIFQAFYRSLISRISQSLLFIPILLIFTNESRQTMHDLLVKTIVVEVKQDA